MRLGSGGSSELSALEREVMLVMFEGKPEQRKIIESQLGGTSVLSRNYSGVGFVTKLQVNAETRGLDVPLRRIEGRHPRVPEPAEFVLTLKDGYLDTLEAFAFNGMWPDDEAGFRFD